MSISARFVCLSLASAVALGSIGCAADSESAGSAASQETKLTSAYAAGTVDGEMSGPGEVTAIAKDASGNPLLRLTVHGEHVAIEPLGDASIAARTIVVPAEVNAQNSLETWNFQAYAYAQHIVGATAATGLQPQQRIDGVSCIAAGGTAMQCWYYITFLM